MMINTIIFFYSLRAGNHAASYCTHFVHILILRKRIANGCVQSGRHLF